MKKEQKSFSSKQAAARVKRRKTLTVNTNDCDECCLLAESEKISDGQLWVPRKSICIEVPTEFSLSQTICSYGYFCLPPNEWVPAGSSDMEDDNGYFQRPLRYGESGRNSCVIRVRMQPQSSGSSLLVSNKGCDDQPKFDTRQKKSSNTDFESCQPASPPCTDVGELRAIVRPNDELNKICLGEESEFRCKVSLAASDDKSSEGVKRNRNLVVELNVNENDEDCLSEILNQVRRMCRLDTFGRHNISEWYMMNADAAKRRWGRLFRSPTLWEDIVKTFLVCNVNWKRSIKMNLLLCTKISTIPGTFPTPCDVVRFSPDDLKSICRLGYRNLRLHRLADQMVKGEMSLPRFEAPERPYDEVYRDLLKIEGIGPFAASNIMQLLGCYSSVPFDSETERHFKSLCKLDSDVKRSAIAAKVKEHYSTFHPFNFLQYWFELWQGYEARDGLPATRWHKGTANLMASGD